MRVILDSSALLAWLRRESGFERVRMELRGGCVTAVNWAECLQKAGQFGLDRPAIAMRFRNRGVELVDVRATDGELAAALWEHAPHLSLADRICLAVAARLGALVITADREWGSLGEVAGVEVELIR